MILSDTCRFLLLDRFFTQACFLYLFTFIIAGSN